MKKNEEMNEAEIKRRQEWRKAVEQAVSAQPTDAEAHAKWEECSKAAFYEFFVKRLVDAGCKVAIGKDGNRVDLVGLADSVINGEVTDICGTWGHPDRDDPDELSIKNPFCRKDLYKKKVILNGIVYEVGKRLGPWEKGNDAYDGTAWQLRPEDGVIYTDKGQWDKTEPRWEKD